MKRIGHILIGSSVILSGCGQPGPQRSTSEPSNVTQPEQKHAYCFFKDEEMKGWNVSRDRNGALSVDGDAHVKDPRYKASFGKVAVGPKKAVFELTIAQNDLGYAMRDNWWHVGAIAPNSASLNEAIVQCGDKIVADLHAAAKG